MSQLSLAHAIGGSPRHVSFVESGRSRPGEALVHRFADVLGVPKRGRNALLRAAGFAPLFSEDPLAESDVAQYQKLMQMVLDKHRPYPGMVIDGGWIVRAANTTARRIFGHDCVGRCSVDLLGELRDQLENFEEVVSSSRQRLIEERFADPDRTDLTAMIARLDQMAPMESVSGSTPVISAKYRVDDVTVETVVTVARFSSATHVGLDELRVELIYPLDELGERFFRALDAS